MARLFERYIGIDYSGAETPTSSLKGLRVYQTDAQTEPREVEPLPGPGSTGLAGGLPSGCARNCPTRRPPSSASIMGSLFPLLTSRDIIFFRIGQPSWTTSNTTGQQTTCTVVAHCKPQSLLLSHE
jgi:hypothetical protein